MIGPDDTLVRWGGEEFLVVARADDAHAAGLVQRGLDATRSAQVEAIGDLNLSVSVGWLDDPLARRRYRDPVANR